MHLVRPSTVVACLAAALYLSGCGCGDPGEGPPAPTPAAEPDWNRGYYIDMDLDSQGRVWLAYQDREDTSLNLALGTGTPAEFTHWQVEGQGEVIGGLLQGNYDGGNYATIALDNNDVPHAAHWDAEDDKLKYARRDGDSWETGTADTGGGRFASIGIVNGNEPIISYYSEGELKVATRSGGSWDVETIDSGTAPEVPEGDPAIDPDVGQFSDLLVHSDGTVWIGYYDAANGNLKIATGGMGAWTIQEWSGEGDIGEWPNLSEHSGDVYIAVQDGGEHDLLFGRWTGPETTFDIVDEGDFIGADASTTWSGDTVAIMYHDGVNNDARLAVDDGTGWILSTHMADGAVGFHNSLVTGGDGQMNWACFNHTSTDIVFQRFSL